MKRIACLAAIVSLAACSSNELGNEIETQAGVISGTEAKVDGVRVFRGIPFAAPPVGELRWREPQPVAAWEGVRDGSVFGDVCNQPDSRNDNIAFLPEGISASEDCLYLNVWTPAVYADDSLPVMLYIYGGAYNEGAGSAPVYDGSQLASRGAVVVTMNYRLGPFGFFVHPALTAESPNGASGNYGIMDMIASMQWIQDNIAAFGGDPDRVTVFGQSAGAMALSTLVASPLTEGLFHRAISQSGTWMGLNMSTRPLGSREQAEQRGQQVAEGLGAETVEELRALSVEQVSGLPSTGNVIIDGYVMVEDATPVFLEGRQNPVDVLTGSNKEELSFALGGGGGRGAGGRGGRGGGGPGRAGGAAALPDNNAQNDGPFWVARFFADMQANIGQEAWLYYFAQNPPGPDGTTLGAVHASELPYVFDNLGEAPLFPDTSDPARSAASQDDQDVADLMASYWVNFAATGDPNGSGLPRWEPHVIGDASNAMIFDANPATESLPPADRLSAIDENFANGMQERGFDVP